MISREKMIALYSAMVKHRALAEQTEELTQLRKLPPSQRLAAGREAIIAAVTADLSPNDTLGGSQSKLLALFVKSSATRNGHRQPEPSADLAAAAKAAETHHAAKKGGVALAFYHDPIKADVWRKQLQRASKGNLPLIVVRLHEAPARKASRNGHAPDALEHGMPLIAVDAADVRAIYRVASESIQRARQGRGPTLIDCIDFGRGALGFNPIDEYETVLAKKRILNAAAKRKIENTIGRELHKTLRHLAS